ncbi:MAG: cation:proton antiporter [Acidobacteriota bacterium]|nr:cation:proton antiporter [Acidobacteriota bacterium]
MSVVIVFSVVLFAALLVSELAERSIVSTAVIFLAAGITAGMAGWIVLEPRDPFVTRVAQLALFSVLFTEGMQLGFRDLRKAWRLPGRALLVGMPLTGLLMAVFARWVCGVSWLHAALIAAVLSPTDPVFAAAIAGREEIPRKLRDLLNVESGVNDGLALPVVLGLITLLSKGHAEWGRLALELTAGIVAGIVIPWIAIVVERAPIFAVTPTLQPLFVFSIGLLVFGITNLQHLNEYLAAFAAGMTVATFAPRLKKEFAPFGGLIAELLKLLALLIFGSLISFELLQETGWRGFVFALLVLVVARPLVLWLVLARSPLDWRERLTAGWFGPRGFASVIYGIMVLRAPIPDALSTARIIAVVILVSIVAHSSTDVPIAHAFRRRADGYGVR